ncbi:ATP-binding protein [Streptomyces violaceus]|uniref:ATP-binding protein n=1 Tax=Streptomyces violaceus TaxID=1936 RepID=UPI00382B7E7F
MAEPKEIAALRRITRLRLGLWGLHGVVDQAQLCVSELASNVVTHVGHGTPATLTLRINGSYLRIEVQDPATRALPVVVDIGDDSERGRGMALVGAVADRWGVQLEPDRKVTWCELKTGTISLDDSLGQVRVTRAEAVLGLYTMTALPSETRNSRLRQTLIEEAVVDAVTDFLYWLKAHGIDGDDVLGRAQTYFESQTAENGDSPFGAAG